MQYLDSAAKALVRAVDGQVVATAVMSAGPAGFAKGVFPGESREFETDMPNLYLLPPVVMKKPAGAIKKKPASHMEADSGLEKEPEQQDPEQEQAKGAKALPGHEGEEEENQEEQGE